MSLLCLLFHCFPLHLTLTSTVLESCSVYDSQGTVLLWSKGKGCYSSKAHSTHVCCLWIVFVSLKKKKCYLFKSDFLIPSLHRNLVLQRPSGSWQYGTSAVLLSYGSYYSYHGCAYRLVTIYYLFSSASLSAPKAAVSILIRLLILKRWHNIWHTFSIQFL